MLTHEKLVAHLANKFSETTQFDAEELISHGRYLLITNARKWDPARGKFSTFLYWLLRTEFISYIAKQRKEVYVDVYEDTVAAPESYTPVPTVVQELFDNLSDDAITLVRYSLASKWGDNWHNLSDLLKKAMLKQGWDDSRFQLAYNEVQQQVKAW
jgi:RNA polymerase sigma factor (sigma-70 family)